jgi:hypothetical protein
MAGRQWHTKTGRSVRSRASERQVSGRLSMECARRFGPDATRQEPKVRIFASFANIAHLHFRLPRQAGERETDG